MKNYDKKIYKYQIILKINDAYPKLLIANTKHDTYQYEGIQVIDISKWLVDEDNIC